MSVARHAAATAQATALALLLSGLLLAVIDLLITQAASRFLPAWTWIAVCGAAISLALLAASTNSRTPRRAGEVSAVLNALATGLVLAFLQLRVSHGDGVSVAIAVTTGVVAAAAVWLAFRPRQEAT